MIVAAAALIISSAEAIYTSVYNKRLAQRERDILKDEMRAVTEYYSATEQRIEEIYKLKHEINNYLSLLNLGEEIKAVTQALEDRTQNLIGEKFCDNKVLNIILNNMSDLCKANSIKFNCAVLISNVISIDELDLCSCFYNLLDNAINANVGNPNNGNAFVSIKASIIGNFMIIKQSNSFYNKIETNRRGEFITSKDAKDNHGFGLKIIEDICERYDGYCEFEINEGVFYSTVGLNLS